MPEPNGMNLDRLYQILRETTVQLRKGEAVEEREVAGIHVTEVYAMPHEQHAEDTLEKVDCSFLVVGVDKNKAEQFRDEFVELLKRYPEPARLAGGPSYIEVGGVIGDQGAAFQLFALGHVLGLWSVITPETLGITGARARELAGLGFVMISGFNPPPSLRKEEDP